MKFTKRLFDVVFSALGLVVLSPLFFLLSLAIKLTDRGPIFYRQQRVGQRGKNFWLLKFRSMVDNAETMGPRVTKDGDERVTQIGRWLRRSKLDELPQLWNVLLGEMTFVGPRPEVPEYVAAYTPAQREILKYRPGITDLATLVFRDEGSLLRNARNVDEFYVRECLPRKIELNQQYARSANLIRDIWIILQTLCPYWLGIVLLYIGVFIASFILAYELRFEFTLPPNELEVLGWSLMFIVPLKLLLLFNRRQFTGLLSYFSVPELRQVAVALGQAVVLQLGLWSLVTGIGLPPRSVILVDGLISLLTLCAIRLSFRMAREHSLVRRTKQSQSRRRVAIIGAGQTGASLARELSANGRTGLKVVAFFDDDHDKWHKQLHGVPIAGMPEAIRDGGWSEQLDEVIIATPSAPPSRIGEIVKILLQAKLKFEIVPSLTQLATGTVKVSQLRPVEIQDLLGRPSVQLHTDNIQRSLEGRVVMVTGAGGSIGSELCRQIAGFGPKRLILVERAEGNLFPIEQELKEKGCGDLILPEVADIRDMSRMRKLFAHYQPAMVFHAAAHKHVPMMELQPLEAVNNNSLGTAQLADLALEYGVDRFVLISTDKAIHPASVMGATKRLAETYVQSVFASQPERTKFMAVRFGNVLGSSGSVIPIFQKQIAAGGPVKVTHPEMQRYFMTVTEAVGLVLQCGAQAAGGEIFVLDMGEPVKIVDLARQLIELSGFKPEIDIKIEFVGMRPGEKLYEELHYHKENYAPTLHPKITRFTAQPVPLEHIRKCVQQLTCQMADGHWNQNGDHQRIKELLKQAVPEYQPWIEETKDAESTAKDRESAIPNESLKKSNVSQKLNPIRAVGEKGVALTGVQTYAP